MYNPSYSNPALAQYIQSGTNDIQGVRWVASLEEVRSASVPFGRNIFMDQTQEVFYIKDAYGNVRAFRFEEIPVSATTVNPSDYVTKKEFDDLRSKYESLVQQQSAASANQQPSQPHADNAANAAVPGFAGAGQAGVPAANSGFGNEQAAGQSTA